MKRKLLITTLLLLAMKSFAGYWTNTRAKCKWWQKKYAANAWTFSGYPDYMHRGDCNSAYVAIYKYCVFQTAYSGPSGEWGNGSVTNRFCSRGEEVSKFDQFFIPDNRNNSSYIEESSINTNPIVFDSISNSVAIDNISGKINLQKGNGYFSKIRLSIWKPSDDEQNYVEDTIMDSNEVLHQLEITVTDNGVSVRGDIASRDVLSKMQIVNNLSEASVRFSEIAIRKIIDPAIDINKLAVRIEGDGAPDKEENIKRSLAGTDNLLTQNSTTFSVHPNPVSDILKIKFNNPKKVFTQIAIYNSKGDFIMEVDNKIVVNKKEDDFEVNVSHLPLGLYFILVDSGGSKYSKQFIKK